MAAFRHEPAPASSPQPSWLACHSTFLWGALVTVGEVFLGTFVIVTHAQVCDAPVAQMHNMWTKSGFFHSERNVLLIVWEIYLHICGSKQTSNISVPAY